MGEYVFNNSIVRYLIGSSRIKYVVLDNIMKGISAPNGILFHVDAHSIFYRIFREKNLSDLMSVDNDIIIKDLTVNFINVLAHYRKYMAAKLHATNDIIVYFNTKCPQYQERWYPNYRSRLYEKYDKSNKDYGRLWECTKMAYEFITQLCQYFSGIYIIDNSNIDDFSAMYHFMNIDKYANALHIIYSRDMFATQLLSRPNTIQLISERDKSYILTGKNAINEGILRGTKKQVSESITPDMLPMIWTLTGCRSIGIDKSDWSTGFARSVKNLNDLASNHMIYSGMSIQEFLKAYSEVVKDDKVRLRSMPSELLNRYKVLDIPIAYKALSTDQIQRLGKNYYDLFDQNMLEALNELLANLNSDSDLLELTALNMDTGIRYNDYEY